MFKIATWNVNSLRVRLPQVLDWLARQHPHVLALQETKLVDESFPRAEIEAIGYQTTFTGQKTYNGVAVLSRSTATDVTTDLPNFTDPQRRVLGVTLDDLRILNLYVPNGQAVGTEKYAYKLLWLEKLAEYLESQLMAYPRLIVLGDFNIAPEEQDVHDPAQWEGKVLFSQPERRAFARLIELGFTDTFRLFDQQKIAYSWWDYRAAAFRRNRGLRIDHILASPVMAERCTRCVVDAKPRRLERPSDHAPVVAEFTL